MLYTFRARNFCSFKEEAFFSMEPASNPSKRHQDNIVNKGKKSKNLNILKSAVICGENAGGKTTFFKSLKLLQDLFNQKGKAVAIKNHLFNRDPSHSQYFEIEVVIDEHIYTYELELSVDEIMFEHIAIRGINQKNERDKNKSILKFEDDELDLDFGYILDANKKAMNSQKDYRDHIFVSKLAYYEPIVSKFTKWLKEDLLIILPQSHGVWSEQQLIQSFSLDEEHKKAKYLNILKHEGFIDIFKLVDPTIKSITVNEISPFHETLIIRKTTSNETLSMQIASESTGVKDFFWWSIYLWQVVYENKTLIADELDAVFNVVLANNIVNFMHRKDHQGQFIFATHNIFHLNTDQFMKEQLYFVTKDNDTLESTMYSLAAFANYRYDKKEVYELYLKGILGGVPHG